MDLGIRFPIDITGVDMRLRHSWCLSTSSIDGTRTSFRQLCRTAEYRKHGITSETGISRHGLCPGDGITDVWKMDKLAEKKSEVA